MADEVQLRGPYAEWRGPYEFMTDTQATANAKAAEKAEAKAPKRVAKGDEKSEVEVVVDKTEVEVEVTDKARGRS